MSTSLLGAAAGAAGDKGAYAQKQFTFLRQLRIQAAQMDHYN
jgi:hypothetical protein